MIHWNLDTSATVCIGHRAEMEKPIDVTATTHCHIGHNKIIIIIIIIIIIKVLLCFDLYLLLCIYLKADFINNPALFRTDTF